MSQRSTYRDLVFCLVACLSALLSWPLIGFAQQNIEAFMDEALHCSRYVFPPGELPAIRWERPLEVEKEVGSFPLKIAYYGKDMKPVVRADRPGRYAATVQGVTPTGFLVKRYLTLYCAPVDLDDYGDAIPVKLNMLDGYGIPLANWDLYEKRRARFSFGSMKMLPTYDPDAAVFLAGLADLDTVNAGFDTPRLRDRQWWISFKQKEQGKSVPDRLLPPRYSTRNTSPALDTAVVGSSIYTADHLSAIRAVCRDWAEKGREPLVTLIAHKGRIVFHEAFGGNDGGGVPDRTSPMWMASITKLLTGVLMMMFVDQGLVELDSSVGRYLPELSAAGNARLTVRHLFTHTSGLDRAGEWASDWNQALENQVAHVLPEVKVGKGFSYNRVGYALAGRIMEHITGTAVPYLFREYLFAPLGMGSAFSDNTYGGLSCSPLDLARLGQMLLSKGSYNGRQYFSEKTFSKLLPMKLPSIDRSWGIGTSPMTEHGLSKQAFGHSAASGALFRVDPAHDLVIISARNRVGLSNQIQKEYAARLIEACTAPLHQH